MAASRAGVLRAARDRPAAPEPGRLDLRLLAARDPRRGVGRRRPGSPRSAPGDVLQRAHVRRAAAADRAARLSRERLARCCSVDARRLRRRLGRAFRRRGSETPGGGRAAARRRDGGHADGVHRHLERRAHHLPRRRRTPARVRRGAVQHRCPACDDRRAAGRGIRDHGLGGNPARGCRAALGATRGQPRRLSHRSAHLHPRRRDRARCLAGRRTGDRHRLRTVRADRARTERPSVSSAPPGRRRGITSIRARSRSSSFSQPRPAPRSSARTCSRASTIRPARTRSRRCRTAGRGTRRWPTLSKPLGPCASR